MDKETASLRGKYGQMRFAGVGLRTGIAKEKLIFIIICSVAIAVAAVTMLSIFISGGTARAPITWQCLQCNYEFTSKTTELPPIDCPKCNGQAVRAHYRSCPVCKKNVLMYRMRLTEQGRARRASRGKDGGRGERRLGLSSPWPMEFQYWIKQHDGSYGWSPWIDASSPQARQIKAGLQCPHCGANLIQHGR